MLACLEILEKSGIAPSVSAARTLVDLARSSCYSGLHPVVKERIDTAARRKAMDGLQQLRER